MHAVALKRFAFDRACETAADGYAVKLLQERGLDVTGPLPADTLFFRAGRGDFDLVVAMYHDQGHGPVKVLLLHGGPGIGHEYLEAMESFLPEAGIEIYYYDQLGVNFSDQPKDPSLWTLERYC